MVSSDKYDVSIRTLEEIKQIHKIDDDWNFRFATDKHIAEQKAEEYRSLGFDAVVYPHPDDVSKGEIPKKNDRCVVYTTEKSSKEAIIDDKLL